MRQKHYLRAHKAEVGTLLFCCGNSAQKDGGINAAWHWGYEVLLSSVCNSSIADQAARALVRGFSG
jgi:hypothetical protein